MLERFNEEIRRRSYVARIFPNSEICLRLVRALAVETHENWMEANRYINMDDLKEHKTSCSNSPHDQLSGRHNLLNLTH
jgi:transposase-like protein